MSADSTRHAGQLRVFFDATRLIARTDATPTGIDRVDLAYVRALGAHPGFDLRLCKFDVFGPKLLHARQSTSLIEDTSRRWQSAQAGPSPTAKALKQWLNSAPGSSVEGWSGDRRKRIRRPGPSPGVAWKRSRDAVLSRRLVGELHGPQSLYLNTSHGRLFRKSVARWLKKSSMPGVFFIHDLIPIQFPEFNRVTEPARHAARLLTVSRYARCVIVNSEATCKTLLEYFRDQRLRVPRIEVASLGVERRFVASPNRRYGTEGGKSVPYFVVLGTIEPRKNHGLLLEVWRRLVEALGAEAPRLLILGRRGWHNQSTFEQLDALGALQRHVVECPNLSDQELADVMTGARALLCPSFAEGFSLPVVEALASRTPVIASDIAAHREVTQGFAELLDPVRVEDWASRICQYAEYHSAARAARVEQLATYRAPTWQAHFDQVLPLLGLAAAKT
tara:strand:- start:2649 stop:3992 length:1344 start_codon:yes stop_codon:yes gene_type:complete